jgi:hypothetical protein
VISAGCNRLPDQADKGEVVGLQVGPARRGRVADTEGEYRGASEVALLTCSASSWARSSIEIQYEECLDLLIALIARVGFGENLRSEGT